MSGTLNTRHNVILIMTDQHRADCKRKYIWFPRTGREQFFDLQKDPDELICLIDTPKYAGEIAVWRSRLVKELSDRPGLVDNGKLLVQNRTIVSPYRDQARTEAGIAR